MEHRSGEASSDRLTRPGRLHTCYQKGSANADDPEVPNSPKICRIEQSASITELPEFFVCKSCDPDIQQYLSWSDCSRVPLHEYRIIENEE